MARIRQNVWKLPAGDQTLVWYERAIKEMQNRPITDPTSWRYQAAIHDYDRGRDPLIVAGEALPSNGDRKQFWQQCQHGSWFFLPWHRMYLHFFEEIVAAAVVTLGGPQDWALPYWNYSADLQSRLLPEPFRNPTLPDGSKNYLYVAERDPACNAGQPFADDGDVALRTALTQSFFSDPIRGNFGGLLTDFSHSGRSPGELEKVPHGAMHMAVGGSDGWMGSFNTAGLDPIFWLHHANIDRLWEVWINSDSGHLNPTLHQWLNLIGFSFHDAAGQPKTVRCLEVVKPGALVPTYDDVSNPLAAPASLEMPAFAVSTQEATMPESLPPELVGATETGFKVKDDRARIRVPTPFQAAAQTRSLAPADEAAASAPQHVILQLENLTARGRANSYDVYVNVPHDEQPSEHPERHAGRLDLFGIAEASRASNQHPGTGLTYTLDISDIYQQLSSAEHWDPDNIDVDLVPVRKWSGSTVTVGRVSLFFA